ncbi:MAG: TRAP transporter small permease [Geminicoccaceae bacterium]|nr:TRAP transporter small permease [Geminicoccaceae bacterium]
MTIVFRVLAALFRAMTGLAFLVLIASVLIQVVSRMLLPSSPVWTEELSRFALLYVVAFGCGLGWRTGELVNVDIVPSNLTGRSRTLVEGGVVLVSTLFALFLLWPGWAYVKIGFFPTSPALGIKMWWVNMAVLVAPVSLAVFGIERVLRGPPGAGDPAHMAGGT